MVALEGIVVHTQTRQPLAKAHVRLSGVSPNDVEFLTGADGKFQMQAKPGSYMLSAHKTGFLSWSYGQRQPLRSGRSLELTAGQSLPPFTAELIPGGVVAGTVIDELGNPVTGANVSILRTFYWPGGKRGVSEAGRTVTDDRGQYRLHSLNPGRYLLRASTPLGSKLAGLRYAGTYFPSAESVERATWLQVTAGGQLENTVVQIKPTLDVTVRGMVIDTEDGGPVSNVNLMMLPDGMPLPELGPSAYVRDPAGHFEFRFVRPGRYIIYTNTTHKGRRYALREKIDVRENMDPLRLRMSPALRLSGKVRVEGEGGLDMTKLIFGLEAAGDISGGGGAKVDAAGEFYLENLDAGVYEARVPNLENAYLKSITLGGRPLQEPYLILDPGTMPQLEVTVSLHDASITGTVKAPDGKASSFAAIVAIPTPGSGSIFNRTQAEGTKSDGTFRLAGLGPGEYRVYAFANAETGAWYDPEFLKPFEKFGTTVKLEERESRALTLVPADAER